VLIARLTVDRGEFFIPDPPPAGATKIPVTVIDSSTGEVLSRPASASESPGVGAITLDVAVRIPGNLFVRGRGLDSEWRGRVEVAGTSAAPIITGKLESVRGSFAFLGKSFQLTQGVIGFDGGAKVDPTLDIETQATTTGMTATVTITGTASSPVIKLSSDPPLPQDEVLAQLLFGKSMGQITPAQGVQLAATAASMASGGPGVLDRVRSKLGLDRFEIGSAQNTSSTSSSSSTSGSGSSSSSTGNTQVSAGKYVADGVYVGVDQTVSGQSRAKVEVEVTPHISVETDVGSQNGSGIGLNWKTDY
jgi:translocation and assembly module TamB